MLRELHGQAAARSSLASLANLPVRASADGVRPVVCDGKPAYDDAGCGSGSPRTGFRSS